MESSDPTTATTPTPTTPTSTRVEMYQATLKAVPPGISALLAEYAGIPPSQQKAHITAVRDRAYATHPYPCLGRWRFLELDLACHPIYRSEILPALTRTAQSTATGAETETDTKPESSSGPSTDATTAQETNDSIFLDLGCCLGQDIRKLIYDGADPSRLYGADLNPAFIDIGYELFRDQDKFPRDRHFIAPADVFDFSDTTELSRRCDGRVGILHVCAVFHLFGLDEQKIVARRCLKLVDCSGSGGAGAGAGADNVRDSSAPRKRALICGAQAGNVRAGYYSRGGVSAEGADAAGDGHRSRARFRHNEESWRQMWEEVVAEEAWKGKVAKVHVHATMEERMFGEEERQGGTDTDTGAGTNTSTGTDQAVTSGDAVNNTQRQIGRVEDGFRWMRWWVWIDFV